MVGHAPDGAYPVTTVVNVNDLPSGNMSTQKYTLVRIDLVLTKT